MNVAEMINSLSVRLQDAAQVNFTDALLEQALNNAQKTALPTVLKEYLTELQWIQASLTATGGEYALSSLTYPVYGGAQGIVAVKIAGGDWCLDITQYDLKKIENMWLSGSINNPLYYVFQSKIYVTNGQTNPSIDVYYLKVPAEVRYKYDISEITIPVTTGFVGDDSQNLSSADDAYNGAVIKSTKQDSFHVVTAYSGVDRTFTVEPAAAVEFGDDEIYFITNDFDTLSIGPVIDDAAMDVETCQLNNALHVMTLDLAEAECWSIDAQPERQKAAEVRAAVIAKALNERYKRAAGIGTKGTNQ